jgi:hypothetical protein
MSFPCTTRLSVDFFRSLVSIVSEKKPKVISECFESRDTHSDEVGCNTVGLGVQLDDIANANVDNA